MIDGCLRAADDDVQEAWLRIRIEPEKWRCSPWGDAGGGFWVVALQDDSVVWYNDIEDGFNVSKFTTRGVIDEYLCNQDSLNVVLSGLPEAQRAEAYAEDRSADVVPAALCGPGTIIRRQTTFWEVHPASGAKWRLHFSGKQETVYRRPHYDGAKLLEVHALLSHYAEPWSDLYLVGSPSTPKVMLEELGLRVAARTGGWRALSDYANDSMALRSVIERGYGLLLRGPRSVIEEAQECLGRFGVEASVLGTHMPRNGRVRVLELTSAAAVVARAFRFERAR